MKVQNEELCNLLVQSLVAKDENLLQDVMKESDEEVIKDIINRVPIAHIRKLLIGISDILTAKLSQNSLKWLQILLSSKASAIATMADGPSILVPLLGLLEDVSRPEYYLKMQGLKGKLVLLEQLKEAKRSDIAETVIRAQAEPEQPAQMTIESETDTESEEDFENDQDNDAELVSDNEENDAEDDDDDDDDEEEDEEVADMDAQSDEDVSS